jgi:UTP--glucose-1-phosphate uridylyltransferase
VAVQEVPLEHVSRYGVIDGPEVTKGVFEIQQFVEKPSPAEAPSNQAVIGRYVLTPEIYPFLLETKPGKDGEIRLADTFAAYLAAGHTLFGSQFSGKRYDCGNKLQFIIAQIELGLVHPEVKQELQAYLDTNKS